MPNDNPELRFDLPDAPNVDWQDVQFQFTGQWLPALEPALIGPENFAELTNLRYNDAGIEGVSGYTKYNTTALDASSTVSKYDNIKTGIQLRTNRTTKSHVLVYAKDSRGTGRIYQNTTAVDGTQGNFDTTTPMDTSGNAYDQDSEDDLVGRFSLAPQNSAVFCNAKENLVFSGFEHTLGSAFGVADDLGTNVYDRTVEMNDAAVDTDTLGLAAELCANPTFEADATNWSAIDGGSSISQSSTQAYGGDYSLEVVAAANEDGAETAVFTTIVASYRYTFWVYSTQTTVQYRTIGGAGAEVTAWTSATVTANEWSRVSFTDTQTNGAGAKLQIAATAAETFYIDNVSIHLDGYSPQLILMTTRPVQAFKFYMSTVNATAGTANVQYWTAAGWTNCANQDYTDAIGSTSRVGHQTGVPFDTDGWHQFDHTYGSADLKHFQELYLYAYRVTMTGSGSAVFQQITCDPGMQPLANVWDGVYRQPLQFQTKDTGVFNDYTLHVNQSSDLSVSIGAELAGLEAANNDEIYIMFEEQVSGIRLKMWEDDTNSDDATVTMYYWAGDTWTQLTAATHNWIDGTLSSDKTSSFGKTGLMEWTAPTDEESQNLFGSVGYVYKLVVGGSAAMTNATIVDTCTGIPANITALKKFDFSVPFKDRLMLGSFSDGEEGNRMDYSSVSTPDVWNGFQSSDYGWQSLRFGGTEKMTCATQLFNRFGASIFAMLLVFKNTELYILTGDSPTDFQIFPVSKTVGCPAPYTLDTAEVGLDVGEGLTRNIAVWLSHAGPMMFDGAVLLPIQGIDNYFDPNEEEFIEWDRLIDAQGWIDPVYKEYNLLIPSGTGEIKNNAWLVYDLQRKKWFRKHPGSRRYPQCALQVMHTTGQKQVLGGTEDGFLYYLESGTTWDGEGITQRCRTGDFWPTQNIWDSVLIRKFKLHARKISESGRDLSIYFYADTLADSGVAVDFSDSTDTDMSFADSTDTDMGWAAATTSDASLDTDSVSNALEQVTKVVKDLNRIGWAHSVAFECTTYATKGGFKPLYWGLRYRVERKDDTAT